MAIFERDQCACSPHPHRKWAGLIIPGECSTFQSFTGIARNGPSSQIVSHCSLHSNLCNICMHGIVKVCEKNFNLGIVCISMSL